MSQEAAMQFISFLNEDKDLAEKLNTATRKDVLELARSKGCEMTMDEFRQALLSTAADRDEREDENLSDEHLEQVSGGIAPVVLVGLTAASVAWASYEVYKMGKRHDWW